MLNWIRNFLVGHRCYFGRPVVRVTDNRLIRICYECNRERVVKAELRPSAFAETKSAETTQ